MSRLNLSQIPWLLLTSLMASLVLVGVSVASYASALSLSQTMDGGQLETVFATVLRQVRARGTESNVLTAILEEQTELGLRALVLLGSDGSVVTVAGDPVTSFPCMECGQTHRKELGYVGTRMWLSAPAPPKEGTLPAELRGSEGAGLDGPPGLDGPRDRAEGGRGRGGPPQRPPDGRMPPRPGWRPGEGEGRADVLGREEGGLPDESGMEQGGPLPPPGPGEAELEPSRRQRLLLEVEPVLSTGLQERAVRNLIVSSVVSTLLMISAGLAWRLQRRAEQERQRMEQERKLAALGQMSSVLAHELRNPLASLKGNAQLLVEQLDGKVRSRAERVVGEAERMERLITDLLEFVRAGRLDRQMVDVSEVLGRAAESVAPSRIHVASPPQLSWSLDPGRIHQALTNLLDNAVKVSPVDGKVEVTAKKRRGHLVLTVRDWGPGIAEGDREKIFEPFFTTRTQGVGLGLMVVKTVIERHGGHIEVGRPPGGGALFTLTLPAA